MGGIAHCGKLKNDSYFHGVYNLYTYILTKVTVSQHAGLLQNK